MQWQQHLREHQATPPPEVWHRLEERLRQGTDRLGSRLEDLEVPPPETVWPTLSARLQPPRRGRHPVVRLLQTYAMPAAAACLALFAAIRYAPQWPQQRLPGLTAAVIPPPPRPPVEQQPATPTATPPGPGQPTADLAAAPTTGKRRNTPADPRPTRRQDPNYIQVCDAKADNCRRLNYKLEDMARCLGHPMPAPADPCGQALRQWTERMGRSTYVPAPGHFLDIVEMVEALQSDR